jgi:hypothetical protein
MHLWIQCMIPFRVGCPIRISTDQRLLAAPRGFSQRATSFIASWCQGIHRMPFSYSIQNAVPGGKPGDQASTMHGNHRQTRRQSSSPSLAALAIRSANRPRGPMQHISHTPLNTRRPTLGRPSQKDSFPGQTCVEQRSRLSPATRAQRRTRTIFTL